MKPKAVYFIQHSRTFAESFSESASGVGTTEISAFLYRYPAWRRAILSGDFARAGAAAQRSKKLATFRSLLQWLAGDRAFLAFAFYWLGEFDATKEDRLEALFSGKDFAGGNGSVNPYAELFEFARPTIAATSLTEFRLSVLADSGVVFDASLFRLDDDTLHVSVRTV